MEEVHKKSEEYLVIKRKKEPRKRGYVPTDE